MIGYHHVLMLIIAVAIILLCECRCRSSIKAGMSLTYRSTPVGGMLIIIPANPQHIPDLFILRKVQPDQGSRSGPNGITFVDFADCWWRRDGSPSGILRYLHSTPGRLFYLQCQRNGTGSDCYRGSRSSQPDLGRIDV